MPPAKHLWLIRLRASSTAKTNPQNIDVLDQLSHLGALREAGELTAAEYDSKKAELRAQILAT